MKLIPKFLSLVARFDELSAAKRLAIRAGTLLATVGVAAVLLWELSGFGPAERSAQRHYDELEAMGVPLNLEDFVASFAVPPEQNCAPDLMPLLRQLELDIAALPDEERRALQLSLSQATKENQLALQERSLQRFQSHLIRIDSAMVKSRFVPDKDWTDPHLLLFPEFAQFRSVVKMSGKLAWLSAKDGDRAGAKTHLQRCLRVSELTLHQPSVIGYLVSIACKAITISEISVCAQVDPAGVDTYLELLEKAHPPKLAPHLRGEAYMAVAQVRHANIFGVMRPFVSQDFSLDDERQAPGSRTWGLPADPFVRAMTGVLLKHYARYIDLAAKSLDAGNTEQWHFDSIELGSELEASGGFGPNVLARVMISYIPANSATRTKAALVTTESLLKVIRHHNQTGAWPKSLEQAGASAVDPFSFEMKPLHLKVSSEEVRVYSIGEDRQNDAGLSRGELTDALPSYEGKGDIVAIHKISAIEKRSKAP